MERRTDNEKNGEGPAAAQRWRLPETEKKSERVRERESIMFLSHMYSYVLQFQINHQSDTRLLPSLYFLSYNYITEHILCRDISEQRIFRTQSIIIHYCCSSVFFRQDIIQDEFSCRDQSKNIHGQLQIQNQ